MKNEFNIECEICGFNIQNGLIVDGRFFCWNCFNNMKWKWKRKRKIKGERK